MGGRGLADGAPGGPVVAAVADGAGAVDLVGHPLGEVGQALVSP